MRLRQTVSADEEVMSMLRFHWHLLNLHYVYVVLFTILHCLSFSVFISWCYL